MDKEAVHAVVITGTVLCAVWVVLAEEIFINVFTVWNLVPVLEGYVLYRWAAKTNKASAYGGAIGFAMLGVGFTILAHAAWFFDWGQTKTGSSTSALIFIILPIYAAILGAVGYIVGWGITWIMYRRKNMPPNEGS